MGGLITKGGVGYLVALAVACDVGLFVGVAVGLVVGAHEGCCAMIGYIYYGLVPLQP
jgi:hypothetical protein